MANLKSNVEFQLRKVKELRNSSGKTEILTHPDLGKVKEKVRDDQTLRLLKTDRSALQFARNYCNRSDERKGLGEGEKFLGVVVVQFEDSSIGAKPVPSTIPQIKIAGHSARRKAGTTTWLYYVQPETCKAFHIDTTATGEHLVGEKVES